MREIQDIPKIVDWEVYKTERSMRGRRKAWITLAIAIAMACLLTAGFCFYQEYRSGEEHVYEGVMV